jgi:hypothetical protein
MDAPQQLSISQLHDRLSEDRKYGAVLLDSSSGCSFEDGSANQSAKDHTEVTGLRNSLDI